MPTDMLIKQIPDDLKTWVADEAKRHHRSMNKEVITLFEKARAENRHRPRASDHEIQGLLEQFRALPTLDARSADEIIGYDESGLPE